MQQEMTSVPADALTYGSKHTLVKARGPSTVHADIHSVYIRGHCLTFDANPDVWR